MYKITEFCCINKNNYFTICFGLLSLWPFKKSNNLIDFISNTKVKGYYCHFNNVELERRDLGPPLLSDFEAFCSQCTNQKIFYNR